jgi:hypothetical protein
MMATQNSQGMANRLNQSQLMLPQNLYDDVSTHPASTNANTGYDP